MPGPGSVPFRTLSGPFQDQSPWGDAYAPIDGQGNSADPQLYDLSQDIGQIKNIVSENEDTVACMSARLDAILNGIRTRPV